MVVQIIYLLVGLGLLVIGAQRLVMGASTLALRAGLTPLVVGLTVVAYGTSAPEMAVSVKAASTGQVDLAIGNIVGSNIFNVLFILGASALISPLIVSKQLIRLDVPIMIGVSILMLLFAQNGQIEIWESALLLIGLCSYTWFLIRLARKETAGSSIEEKKDAEQAKKRSLGGSVFWIALGLGLLVFGSRLLVDAAITIAGQLGVSEVVVGLTIVAAGTSLPEVATSIMATLKGERDIAVGNVVGSNIFNILAVGGVSGLVSGTGLPVSTGVLHFDIPVMTAVALACLPIFFTGHLIARWEGFVFLGYYVAYTAYLVMTATNHPMIGTFTDAMVWFVIPLTLITLIVFATRSFRKRAIAP